MCNPKIGKHTMKTIKEITSEIEALEYMNSSLDEIVPLEDSFATASAISTKLLRWKNDMAYETNLHKQLEIIAKMIHFSFSGISLAANKRDKDED